jgi:hypothetical protein
MLEYSIDDIFVEPFVRYKKNPATGEYDGFIQITNASADTFDASYVLGIDNATEAELYWTMCHRLYLRTGEIVAPPSELTDCPLINSYGTAKNRLYMWLRWMGAKIPDGDPGFDEITIEPKVRLSVTVPWEVGRYLHLCQHVYVNLPHHTEGAAVEAMVESVTHDLTDWTSALRLILFGATDSIEYYIKDTFGTGVAPDWKDTFTEYETHGEGQDIKDTY